MKYKSASSPRYVDAGQTGIALDVVFILQEGVAEVPAIPPSDTSPGQAAIPAVPEVLSDPWPFFAVPTDSEAHGRELYAKAVAGDFGPVAAYLPPPPPPVVIPASITRRQCAIELLNVGLITEAEALAMVTTATPPAFVATLIDNLPEADKMRARINFAADTYDRANPLIVELMAAAGKTPADADAFFVAAAKL
jgi:hypothetical protein